MIPNKSVVRAYDVSHLIEHAAHWRDLAERRRSVVGAIYAQARSLDWEGQGHAAMQAAMAGHLSTAEEEARLLEAAAQTAENGATVLHQQQQSILSGADQARRFGFAVGEDWLATDAMYPPGSTGWYARQPTAQTISADLRTQAAAFAAQEAQTAADVIQAAGGLGGEGAVRRHIQAAAHGFKTDGPTPSPSPPHTGDPIKLPPHPTPPQVITAEPHDPVRGFPKCDTDEVLKREAEVVVGCLTGAAGLASTPLGGIAGLAGGGWMIWDGLDALLECK